MQFVPFDTDIEVNGQTVNSIIDGLGTFKSLANTYLLKVGIGKKENDKYVFNQNEWYSQKNWLKAFQSIAQNIGDNTLFKIGLAIPKNAQFPPWVKDIESAIKSIDIAYHMNHRKGSQLLFNPDSGEMFEGIGHYGFEKVSEKNMIVSECKNPYPCTFDRGIVTAMAQSFQKKAIVKHDDSKPCRKDGAESCTYVVTW